MGAEANTFNSIHSSTGSFLAHAIAVSAGISRKGKSLTARDLVETTQYVSDILIYLRYRQELNLHIDRVSSSSLRRKELRRKTSRRKWNR